jgi:cytochrome b
MARRATNVMLLRMKVWDAPIRLFHWVLVVLIATSYVSVKLGWMQTHLLSGYSILTLLLFRLVWGFAGSDTARFASFLRSPLAGIAHLRALGRREPDQEIGHNAAGGWMVLVMLGLIGVQAVTGLFSNDDALTEGPLKKYVGQEMSDRITDYHAFNFNLLFAAMGLHVLAILVYLTVKRQNLIRPMITGYKRLPAASRAPRFTHPVAALLTLAVAAGIVWAMVRFA